MRNITAGIALRLMAGGALIAVAAFVGGVPGTASSQESPAGTVTVIASWTGNTKGTEGYDFRQVLNAFHHATGIHVTYTGTRALDQLLQSDIQQGSPPDLAILPSPGELLQYQREGYLQSLDSVLNKRQVAAAYGMQWLTIMKLGTSSLYTLPVKADLQNLVWYDPQHWAGSMPGRSQPPSWSQLVAIEKAAATKEKAAPASGGAVWCLGLDSPPASGWPGTDWIGNILLAQSGISYYKQWADGTLAWTSPQVRNAWQVWGSLVARPGQVYGGSNAALLSPWTVTGTGTLNPLFTNPPGCYLQDAASFITLPYQEKPNYQSPETGYDFFPFPAIGLPDQTSQTTSNAWEVSADLLAMFNSTPGAKRLVQFLASEQAQQVWPAIRGGGASSADQQVPLSTYGSDHVALAIARTLTSSSATLCFNASDLMPATMQDAFYQAVMEYLRNTSQLSDILSGLDNVRKAVYKAFPDGNPDFSCGSP